MSNVWLWNSVIKKIFIFSNDAFTLEHFLDVFLLFPGCNGRIHQTKESEKGKMSIIKFAEIIFGHEVDGFFFRPPLSCSPPTMRLKRRGANISAPSCRTSRGRSASTTDDLELRPGNTSTHDKLTNKPAGL